MTATSPSIRAHWRHLANTIELVHPSAHSSPQSKRQMDRFSRFCTAYGRKCLYLQWAPYIHLNCHFPWGSAPPLYHVMLSAHGSPQPKRHLDWFSRLCTDDCGVPLYFTTACLFSLKIAPSMLASGPHLILDSLGPPQSGTQMTT